MPTPKSLSGILQLPCHPKRWILLALFIAPLLTACDAVKGEEAERTSHLVVLVNETGATGCEAEFEAQFRVFYRDVDLFVDIDPGRRANINVNVEDGETINVDVRETSSDGPDTVRANAWVAVRTESRAGDGVRTITFCENLSLRFGNF